MANVNYSNSINLSRFMLTDDYSDRGAVMQNNLLAANLSYNANYKVTLKGNFYEAWNSFYE